MGYCGNALFWWAKNGKGYTIDIRKAHKYTKEEVMRIIKRPQDTAWPCEYIDGLKKSQKLIIDSQYLDHSKEITSIT